MALSDGAVITMCNSSGATLRPTATSRSSSNIAGGSCIAYPVQLNRKSKGKPDNVCQLMAIADQKTSIGSRAPYQLVLQ